MLVGTAFAVLQEGFGLAGVKLVLPGKKHAAPLGLVPFHHDYYEYSGPTGLRSQVFRASLRRLLDSLESRN